MESIELYLNLIIKPLEREIEKTQLKIKKQKFLPNKSDIEYLKKVKKLLFYYYEKFTIFINQELAFEEEFQRKLK